MTVLVRKKGWRKNLVTTIDKYRRSPLAYGGFDCAIFAATCVWAMTGERIGRPEWWRYNSAEAGIGIMLEAGYSNIADMLASDVPELEHKSMARIGDLVAIKVDSPFIYALGVVNGEIAFVPRPDGLGMVDLLQVDRAFKVGV